MTENNTEERSLGWGEVGTPTDLWRAGKSLSAMSPEETSSAWARTVDALEGMCMLAERLMLEPLLLALVGAKIRAEEECERAADALHRPEGALVSEGEDKRLKALTRRSDALNTACVAVEDWSADPKVMADVLEILREMRSEAHRDFMVYRREVGLPEGPLGQRS